MIAFLNGKYLPLADATIPVWDYGFTMGVTVTEQLRTFNGVPFQLDSHLARLQIGLVETGIELSMPWKNCKETIVAVAEKNFADLPPGHDLNIGICVTPGTQSNRCPSPPENQAGGAGPTILIYALPLSFQQWANSYHEGVSLTTVSVSEIPANCLSKQYKTRSRFHYYLADREAHMKRPGSRALLLGVDGKVAEASVATIAMVSNGTIVVPPDDQVLASVSLEFVENTLAPKLEMEFERRPISIGELKKADEILWLGTGPCVLPVNWLDGITFESSAGSVYLQLLNAWSDHVHVDIRQQAERIANP